MLGAGVYSVYAADRGGVVRLGRIDNITELSITFVRDSYGELTLTIVKPDDACCLLLSELRAGRHELVVYRNNQRVWEGPITRLGYYPDRIEIDARDVIWYLSRHALEETLDFTGRSIDAVDAVSDALQRRYPVVGDEYNIGPFLARILSDDDARTAAKHDAYSKTMFELLDKYAEDGGLDYIVRNRSIIVYDTHTRFAVLPKMSDDDFSDPLGVVEYGSELNTRTFSTNNSGTVGSAVAPQEWIDYYGFIDKISNDTDEENADETQDALVTKAERNLARGYPAPVDIVVPANSTVKPNLPVDFMDLMPGAWVPVEALRTCRKARQWQRIDQTSVSYTADGEIVSVTMSQAPAKWVDPL